MGGGRADFHIVGRDPKKTNGGTWCGDQSWERQGGKIQKITFQRIRGNSFTKWESKCKIYA